jgi:hypothetical protein
LRNLLSYDEFLNEQYLPYFGVKQALDDSKQYITNEVKTSIFNRIYSMHPTWWVAWKKENESEYSIRQDAFSKTYEVSKDNKAIFIFDYGRSKIFTNEPASFFQLKGSLKQAEFDKIQNKAEELGKSKDEIEALKKAKEASKEEEKPKVPLAK